MLPARGGLLPAPRRPLRPERSRGCGLRRADPESSTCRCSEDDEIGRHVGKQLCGCCDLLGHRRQRALPFAGNAGARDMHAKTRRCKMVERGSVMLLTEGMIIPIRARDAGKMLSTSRRSTVVTAAMIFPPQRPEIGVSGARRPNTQAKGNCAASQGKASIAERL